MLAPAIKCFIKILGKKAELINKTFSFSYTIPSKSFNMLLKYVLTFYGYRAFLNNASPPA